MRNVRSSILLAVMTLSAAALTLAAPGGAGSSGVTADDLSRDLSVAARMAGALEVSKRLLSADSGMKVNTPLTEARAAAMLQKVGFAVTTSHPDRVLTRQQADLLVQRFRSSLVAPGSKVGATTGKGGLPDSIDSCFDEKNHGSCMDCCKQLGGGGSTCARACMVINKPSASEPIP